MEGTGEGDHWELTEGGHQPVPGTKEHMTAGWRDTSAPTTAPTANPYGPALGRVKVLA